MSKLKTWTLEVQPVRRYTSNEILRMSPDKLKKELTHLCSMEPDMAGKIEAIVEFEPRWKNMTALQYAMIIIAWAMLEDGDFDFNFAMQRVISELGGL